MAQISTLYNIGDVVAICNYYDQIACGVITGIIISNEGIVYDIKVGFCENDTIKVREKQYDDSAYHIVEVVGKLVVDEMN